MKALLLEGFSKKNSDTEQICTSINNELKRHEFQIERMICEDLKVSNCQGCFDCWVKTPGICKIDDDGRKIVKKIVESDIIIHLTPIIFGGYSSELKKVIDRFIPSISPMFTRRYGETHHKYRYKKRASVIVIGVLETPDDEKEAIFKELVFRNSLNMGSPLHQALIFKKNEDRQNFLKEFNSALLKVEALI